MHDKKKAKTVGYQGRKRKVFKLRYFIILTTIIWCIDNVNVVSSMEEQILNTVLEAPQQNEPRKCLRRHHEKLSLLRSNIINATNFEGSDYIKQSREENDKNNPSTTIEKPDNKIKREEKTKAYLYSSGNKKETKQQDKISLLQSEEKMWERDLTNSYNYRTESPGNRPVRSRPIRTRPARQHVRTRKIEPPETMESENRISMKDFQTNTEEEINEFLNQKQDATEAKIKSETISGNHRTNYRSIYE